jgi:hypothetical protein
MQTSKCIRSYSYIIKALSSILIVFAKRGREEHDGFARLVHVFAIIVLLLRVR